MCWMKSKAQWSPDPSLDVCRVERLADRWLISARTAGSNECPDCSTLSTSRHSSYVRQIQDLPDQGSPVTLSVQLDRWRCQNRHCGRKTFVARLPGTIAGPRARRTDRVIELVKLFAYTAGGRPAERLMAKLGIPVSNDTLLRHLKRHQGHRPVAAHVVGVDDWSWVKGESYGTIFVDLDVAKSSTSYPDGVLTIPRAGSRNALKLSSSVAIAAGYMRGAPGGAHQRPGRLPIAFISCRTCGSG